jgi:hypothetical protein
VADQEIPVAAGEGKPAQPLRRLPIWAWLLGSLLFPEGLFICLAATKAMRWWAAVILAIASVIPNILMIQGEREAHDIHGIAKVCLDLSGFLYQACVGQFIYSIGRSHGVWTDVGRRIWWYFGVTWLVIFYAGCLALALVLLLRHFGYMQ